MAKYKVLTGIEWGNRRAEAGEIVDDLPAKSIKWLRESNLIELIDGSKVDVEDETESEQDDSVKDGE
jgi:hypothetical protein